MVAQATERGAVMSVSIREVIETAGYDLTTQDDALWLLSKQNEFAELVEKAELLVETEADKDEA
mgnify:CR=1 FL=1